MQGRGPEGHFEAGTKVGIARNHKPIGDYVWVYEAKQPARQQGYIRKSAIKMDPQGHVLAERDGPGCVVRIWSPNPYDTGKIRIYLDHAEKPVIEAPMLKLLKENGKPRPTARNGFLSPIP